MIINHHIMIYIIIIIIYILSLIGFYGIRYLKNIKKKNNKPPCVNLTFGEKKFQEALNKRLKKISEEQEKK